MPSITDVRNKVSKILGPKRAPEDVRDNTFFREIHSFRNKSGARATKMGHKVTERAGGVIEHRLGCVLAYPGEDDKILYIGFTYVTQGSRPDESYVFASVGAAKPSPINAYPEPLPASEVRIPLERDSIVYEPQVVANGSSVAEAFHMLMLKMSEDIGNRVKQHPNSYGRAIKVSEEEFQAIIRNTLAAFNLSPDTIQKLISQ